MVVVGGVPGVGGRVEVCVETCVGLFIVATKERAFPPFPPYDISSLVMVQVFTSPGARVIVPSAAQSPPIVDV